MIWLILMSLVTPELFLLKNFRKMLFGHLSLMLWHPTSTMYIWHITHLFGLGYLKCPTALVGRWLDIWWKTLHLYRFGFSLSKSSLLWFAFFSVLVALSLNFLLFLALLAFLCWSKTGTCHTSLYTCAFNLVITVLLWGNCNVGSIFF